MGVFGAVNKGLDAVQTGVDKLGDQSGRLVSAALWRATRRRAGDVLDSRRGTVGWVADDADHAFDIVSPGLPATRVTMRLQSVSARVGQHDVDLVIGKQAIRRVTFSASAEVGGHHYLLRQTARRRAAFERDDLSLATLARPRRATRGVDWAASTVTDDEIALAHALAVYAGIGAPGAISNLLSDLSP